MCRRHRSLFVQLPVQVDEIAFMAADTGGAAPVGAGEPSGMVRASGVRLKIVDPRNAHVAYAHLFRRSGTSLDPSAGMRYGQYDFVLTSGAYKTTTPLP